MNFKNNLELILNDLIATTKPYHLLQIHRLLKKAKDTLGKPMRVAIIGMTKAGKSSLLNAILGREFVPVAQEVCTQNLNWFKHAGENKGVEEVKVYKLDGSIEMYHLEDIGHFASDKNQNDIRWIEVFYNHPIFKDFEILDTPGLCSLLVEDSRRTKELLTDDKNKPHALIYMVTREFSATDIEEIKTFHSSSKLMSGLTCVGVLSRVDDNFDKSIFPYNYFSAFKIANEAIIAPKIKRNAEIRNSFCKVLPISAIFSLAANILTDNDFEFLRSISNLEPSKWQRIIRQANSFKKKKIGGIDNERGDILAKKIGINTIGYIVQRLAEDENISYATLRKELVDYSQIKNLLAFLKSHFGRRAMLLKCTLSIAELQHEVSKFKIHEDKNTMQVVSHFNTLLKIWEIENNKYKYLDHFYNNGFPKLKQETEEKAKALLGENGESVKEMLRIGDSATTKEVMGALVKEATYWKNVHQYHYNGDHLDETELCCFMEELCETLINNKTLW